MALVGIGAEPDAAEDEPTIGVVICCVLPSAGTAGLLLPLTCPLGVFDRPLTIPLPLVLRMLVFVGGGLGVSWAIASGAFGIATVKGGRNCL